MMNSSNPPFGSSASAFEQYNNLDVVRSTHPPMLSPPIVPPSPVSAEFTLILDLFTFRREVHEGQLYMLEKVGITLQDIIFGAALVAAEVPHPLTYEQFVPQVGLEFIDDIDFEFIKSQIPGGIYNDPVTNLMEQYSQASYMFYCLYYAHLNAVILPFRSKIGWSKRVTVSKVLAQIQLNTLAVLLRLEGEWP